MTWCSFALVSQNILRTHCPCRPLFFGSPNSVTTFSSNVLQQRVISLELVVTIYNHWAHALICNVHTSYINNSPMAKWFGPIWNSKRFVKLRKLEHGPQIQLALKAWWQRASHSWDSHFFRKSDKVKQSSCLMLLYTMAIHLVSTSANGKKLAPVCTSNGLSNSANLITGGKNNLLLSFPMAWYQGSSHS